LSDFSTHFLVILLICLILFSAFFSGAETGMMAINRYRLRHLARKGQTNAKRVLRLLKRPDRLLGVVLIGNTFCNVFASVVTTIIVVRYWGSAALILSTIILTMLLLIFAETAPKTFGALHPQRAAFSASLPLKIFLTILFPVVWLVNTLANGVLRLFGVKIRQSAVEALTAEELRSVVREATGKISSNYQQMLLRILSLGQITVEDVMVPRHRIYGIDMTDTWDNIRQQLMTTTYEHIPIYRENIEHVIGILNLRKIIALVWQGELTQDNLVQQAEEVYFVPEVTTLNRQLLNFQRENKMIGLVVDEYGDIQGLVTLQDILEEIVGEFALDVEDMARLVLKQKDGSFLVDGRIAVRDLNRVTKWELPTDGPKTLSGLVIEHLEVIPPGNVGLRLAGYPMEVIKVSGNTIRTVQIWPDQRITLLE
jgi:Mg2+/Co2+ transporter CorB